MKHSIRRDCLKALVDYITDGLADFSQRDKGIIRSIVVDGETYGHAAEKYKLSNARIGQIVQRGLRRTKRELMAFEKIKEENRALEKANVILKTDNKKLREIIAKMKTILDRKEITEMSSGKKEEIKNNIIIGALLTPINELDLPVRTLNCLRAGEIETLRDLVRFNKNDVLKFRNFGKKSMIEVENLLESKGLHFEMKLP